MNILLAEDDLLSRELATRVLTRAGHRVTATETGPEAVDAFAAGSFDVVVMDVQLPGMDGLEATAAIRAHEAEHGGHTPILALTAQADTRDRRRCLEAGMDGYLTKPFAIQELIATVESAPAGARSAERAASDAGTDSRPAPIVDWDAALQTVTGHIELLRRMAAMFLEVSVPMEADVRRAAEARDAAALRRAAHKLKGSVTHFAARRATEAAYALEQAGAGGDLSNVDAQLAALRDALRAVREALSQGPPSA